MIAVYASQTVGEENASAFIETAKNLVAATRKESGNISYELVRGIEDPTQFAFMENWVDQESLDAHMQTKHFKAIVPQLGALAKGDTKIVMHEIII